MIANAWYSVCEFHIHLSGMQTDGLVRDGLERAVLQLAELSGLSANASKVEIFNAIREHDQKLKPAKEQLTNMVPYRALAGFFAKSREKADWGSVRRLTEYIRRVNQTVVTLPYTLGESSRLKKEVYFHPAWMKMIQDNTVSILGWIQYEKVKWLQNNNPALMEITSKNYQRILEFKLSNHAGRLSPSDTDIISQSPKNDKGENSDYYTDKKKVDRLQQPYQRAFTPEEIQKIVTAYQSGKASYELGAEFNCSKTTIVKLLKQQGVPLRKSGRTRAKVDDKKVIRMYKEMHTIKEISKNLNVDTQVISRCLKEMESSSGADGTIQKNKNVRITDAGWDYSCPVLIS